MSINNNVGRIPVKSPRSSDEYCKSKLFEISHLLTLLYFRVYFVFLLVKRICDLTCLLSTSSSSPFAFSQQVSLYYLEILIDK